MKILSIMSYRGRNIYSHKPVIKMMLDLGQYGDIATKDIPSLNKKIIEGFPGLYQHKCSLGEEGGFLKRLENGTYLGHVTEHLSLEIQNMAGDDVKFGKARQTSEPNVYTIIYNYKNEKAGLMAGQMAVNFINAVIAGQPFDIEYNIGEIRKARTLTNLGPSTDAIYNEAAKRNIPVERIGESSILMLGHGCKSKMVEATITSKTSCIAVDLACDKILTKEILNTIGIPVPQGYTVNTEQQACDVAADLGYPVVVKPYNGNQGKGVSLNLFNNDDITKAFNIAKTFSENVLVEKQINGRNYRVFVVNGQVVAASDRVPAHVIGDGVNTVGQLIEIQNSDPKRGEDHEKPLTKIKVDDITKMVLKRQNIDMDYIPKPEETVYLKENCNLSSGGVAIDVTDEICEENKDIAIQACQALGLDVAGVDITTPDISQSVEKTGGCVIEVNAAPGIRMHHYPYKGKPRNAAGAIVDYLFPHGDNGVIPIVSVTGTNGKTTTSRMISSILQHNGITVGMTSTGGVYINDRCIKKGDTTGYLSAKSLLRDTSIDAAILETARGGIVKSGLAYNLADVGIITNVTEDHLGIDGIDTLEDLAFVKSLVVEAVKEKGYSILNADDPSIQYVLDRAKGNKILVSLSRNNEIILQHTSNEGKAIYVHEGSIIYFNGILGEKIMDVDQIPATLGGRLQHNVYNSLFAIGAAIGLGIEQEIISQALSKFTNSSKSNPGRFNIYSIKDVTVVVDYGHNIDGYNRVIDGLKKLPHQRLIGIIGVPGDRTDSSTLKVGEISGQNFDYIYIKEDKDLRDREPGEIASLLKRGALDAGAPDQNIKIILSEDKALEQALEDSLEGDLIVVFYEDYQAVVECLEKSGARPLEDIKEDNIVKKNSIENLPTITVMPKLAN